MRALLVALVLLSPGVALGQSTLVRSPSASRDAIAFLAHGDLWTASPQGGRATRLVRSAGAIVAARFSPDGRTIAYTDRVAGGQDVYVVAASGGAPRRLTFDALPTPSANLVVGWTPDSQRVVFLSSRGAWADTVLRAFSASLEGEAPQPLPLGQSGTLSFSPDGKSVAFTRTFTDLSTRKRYIGGQAEDVFTYNLASRQLKRITDWKGTDAYPMWSGRRLYFISDRGVDFRENIWCYDLDSTITRQVTHFTDYDMDAPTLSAGRILFQQGGRLWALELADERLHELSVDVPDDGAHTAPRTFDAAKEVRQQDAAGVPDFALTPDGSDMVVAAHGDLFAVSLASGSARNVTATPGVDEDRPAISPDGRLLAYVTEAGGAQQIAIRTLAGGPERQVTHFTSGVLYNPIFSRDGERLAVADANHRLWLIPLDGGAPAIIDADANADIRDATFSPNGAWLAFSTQRSTGLAALHLYDLKAQRDAVVSTALDGDRLPAFAPDSSALYFVSQRNELPFTTDRGDMATISSLASDGVYAAALQPGANVDLMRRAVRLPVTPGRIVSLEAGPGGVIYETRPPALIAGELPGETAALHRLDVASGSDRVLATDIDGYVLSSDGRRLVFQRDGQWRTADLAKNGADAAINLQGLELTVDPRAEWREMFERTWRLDRDLYFNRAMSGTDWAVVRAAYVKWLPLLGSRQDSLYLLAQVQGELASSHARVVASEPAGSPRPIRTPRLGVDLALDQASGRYRIERIYQGDPTRERFRSPLNAPTLQGAVTPARVGDFLMAIDGRELTARVDPDSLLVGRTGEVTLSLATQPDGPRRALQVRPVVSDLYLRQHDWVEDNRRRVANMTNGAVGYLFVADFNAVGSEDLMRQLQGQLGKDGLIIDTRWNRGGFTSQAVLDVLRRIHVGLFANREGGVRPLPSFVAPRAMVVIANAESGSDGDQFPYFFKAYGLGKVVGERTWGGVQGLDQPWPLMDGTGIYLPYDALASTDGRWLIENEGASPDIEISRAPDEVETGRDSQLDAAVSAVRAELRLHPAEKLKAPTPLPAYPPGGEVPGARFGPNA